METYLIPSSCNLAWKYISFDPGDMYESDNLCFLGNCFNDSISYLTVLPEVFLFTLFKSLFALKSDN